MTNESLILSHLASHPDAICDDCLSRRLAIKPRQQVNQRVNDLAKKGRIRRDKDICSSCGGSKLLNVAL